MLTKLDVQRQLRKLKSSELLSHPNPSTPVPKPNYLRIASPQITNATTPRTSVSNPKGAEANSCERYFSKVQQIPLNGKNSYSNLKTKSKLGISSNRWKKDSFIKLYFKLDSSTHSNFCAGSQVKGEVQLESLTSQIQILEVNVHVLGVVGTLGKVLPNSKSFYLTQGYIPNLSQILQDNQQNQLTNPILNFPFHLDLSLNLPSTFHNKNAAIQYILFSEAKIRYFDETNQIYQPPKTVYNCREILILQKYDLATSTQYLNTQVLGEHTFYNNHIFTNLDDTYEPIKVLVQLDKKLYFSDTQLNLHILGTNCTNLKVQSIELKLVRTLLIFENQPNSLNIAHRIVTCVNSTKFLEKKVLSGFKDQFFLNLDLHVPSSCRTINNCNQFQVTFSVQVTIKTKFRSKVKLELPVVLAHPLSTSTF